MNQSTNDHTHNFRRHKNTPLMNRYISSAIFTANSVYRIRFVAVHLITLAQLNRAHTLSNILYL